MDLDKVAVRLRPRRGVQSVDLGLLLGRRFWAQIIVAWLMLAAPLLVVSQGLVFFATGRLWASLLVGWWLKPLFDRVTLYIVSQGFFGRVPSRQETAEAVLRQWMSWEAVADLTVRRFSLMRPLLMPIRALEGERGEPVRRRIRSFVDQPARMQSYGLLLFLLAFKGVLYFSVFVGVSLIWPEELAGMGVLDGWEYFRDAGPPWGVAGAVILVSLGVTLFLEPFYGAGGFGIYVQRRIEREGWDLELRFRRLARRIAGGISRGSLLLLVSLSWSLSSPTPVYGEEAEGEVFGPVDRSLIPVEAPQEELERILKEPPFGGQRLEKRWRAREGRELPMGQLWIVKELMDLAGRHMAGLLRALLWVVFGAGAVWTLWRVAKFMGRRPGAEEGEERRARWEEEILLASGGELDGAATDILGAAQRSWLAGEQGRAVGVLFLGSLRRFEELYSFRFAEGWTAAHCAEQVQERGVHGQVISELARAFDELVWANQVISESRFEELLVRWEQVFGGSSQGGREGQR